MEGLRRNPKPSVVSFACKVATFMGLLLMFLILMNLEATSALGEQDVASPDPTRGRGLRGKRDESGYQRRYEDVADDSLIEEGQETGDEDLDLREAERVDSDEAESDELDGLVDATDGVDDASDDGADDQDGEEELDEEDADESESEEEQGDEEASDESLMEGSEDDSGSRSTTDGSEEELA
eukprot:gnl/MRDRNA2_/MRDRNA2_95945_c0_seq1.p1 gnl/MRDRNA2_/MRDRNA2_95945_c0~~gnl/MRDRNA2_/MRDRNA2_95945_c0_seq1.p1  ORF type:complete len:182 (+),score=55.05 gnl/MRDRNA2_/MRDRNA2_95945_c0_seq1:78-623(+)